YEIAGVSTDLAACDLNQFKQGSGLIKAVKDLAGQLERGLAAKNDSVKNAILLAHWQAQSYLNDQYVDLYDFCKLLATNPDLKGNCEAITDCFDHPPKVVLKSCYTGPAVQHSHGLSIYFPWSAEAIDNDLGKYKKLKFADPDVTGWADFLEKYLIKTRRD